MAVRRIRAILLTLVLFLAPLAGCFGTDQEEPQIEPDHWLPPVEERFDMIYQADDVFSRVSWNGSYGIGDSLSVFVPVPEIDASDGGAGVTGGAEVHLGLWLPIIEGCDWSSAELPVECQVPVIAEIGPYYD
ncbi:MAG TPA: hypothetical protein HA330_05365, partial [Candidatus Thalassarchaeaceae archaeon]